MRLSPKHIGDSWELQESYKFSLRISKQKGYTALPENPHHNEAAPRLFKITINDPVYFIVHAVMIFLRAEPLRGPLEGLGPAARACFGPWKSPER